MKNGQELSAFKESLMFLHVEELRELALRLCLEGKGNKMVVINRILHFLETGQKLTVQKLPEISRSKRGLIYPLEKDTLMLKGSYKNDLKTRMFFKKLIGAHFHFTAFGIDWLNERWMDGNPPTYQEFANMWQEEYQKRKEMPVAPKAEWAYINFVQKFILSSPEASRECVHQAWESERQQHKNYIYDRLNDFCTAI